MGDDLDKKKGWEAPGPLMFFLPVPPPHRPMLHPARTPFPTPHPLATLSHPTLAPFRWICSPSQPPSPLPAPTPSTPTRTGEPAIMARLSSPLSRAKKRMARLSLSRRATRQKDKRWQDTPTDANTTKHTPNPQKKCASGGERKAHADSRSPTPSPREKRRARQTPTPNHPPQAQP